MKLSRNSLEFESVANLNAYWSLKRIFKHLSVDEMLPDMFRDDDKFIKTMKLINEKVIQSETI